MRRFRLAAAAGAIALAALTPPAVAAPHPQATSTTAPTPANRIRVASQTAWVAPGGTFALRVAVTSPLTPKDIELAVSVFRRVQTRSEYALTLQNRIRSGEISTVSTPLSDLTPDAAGAVLIQLNLSDPTGRDRTALHITAPGVYPVRVELRSIADGDVLDHLVTHLVLANPPDASGQKLGVALVVPVSAPLAIQPDGTRKLDAAAVNRVSVAAGDLAAQPTVPLTLQPTPETLEALETSSREADLAALAALAAALPGRQVVQAPYVPVAVSAMTRELDGELTAQLERGADVVDRVLAQRADPRTWITEERLDDQGLQRLRDRGVDRLVLPEASLAPIDTTVTPAQPYELAGRSGRRPALLVADGGLSAHFDANADPVLAAHQLLADLAVLYNDRPGKPRVVVAQVPRSFPMTDEFTRTLLDGIASSPTVAGMTIDRAFAVPPATGARGVISSRTLAAPPALSSLPSDAILRERRRLDGLTSMLESSNTMTDDLDAMILASEAADAHARQRTAYLEGVEAQIKRTTGLVNIPNERTITLTARTGEIPVTISSRAPFPVRVQLRVDSDKLLFPGSAQRGTTIVPVELTRPNTTALLKVEARATGSFPLRVRLQSPDGALTLASSRFIVRSTATSGVGLVLSIGALGFLIVWWARHLVRGRRNRRLVPA